MQNEGCSAVGSTLATQSQKVRVATVQGQWIYARILGCVFWEANGAEFLCISFMAEAATAGQAGQRMKPLKVGQRVWWQERKGRRLYGARIIRQVMAGLGVVVAYDVLLLAASRSHAVTDEEAGQTYRNRSWDLGAQRCGCTITAARDQLSVRRVRCPRETKGGV